MHVTFSDLQCCIASHAAINTVSGVGDLLWGMRLQVVRDHQLGLSCIWDWMAAHSSNGSTSVPFTTWKFRPDGVSQRTIDFIWCAPASVRHVCPSCKGPTSLCHWWVLTEVAHALLAAAPAAKHCQLTRVHVFWSRFSKDPRLRLVRQWRMPTEGEIGEKGLPCERYPSDHLALCAVFEVEPLL